MVRATGGSSARAQPWDRNPLPQVRMWNENFGATMDEANQFTYTAPSVRRAIVKMVNTCITPVGSAALPSEAGIESFLMIKPGGSFPASHFVVYRIFEGFTSENEFRAVSPDALLEPGDEVVHTLVSWAAAPDSVINFMGSVLISEFDL